MVTPGKKIRIKTLVADKKVLKEFASEDYIKNRKIGKVTVNFPHSFNPDLFICTNTDATKSIYSSEELESI